MRAADVHIRCVPAAAIANPPRPLASGRVEGATNPQILLILMLILIQIRRGLQASGRVEGAADPKIL